MGIFFTWIILSFIVGFIGSDRKIGFGGSFFISLILSPLIGLIFTLISKTNAEENYRESVLETQRSQQESLKKLSESKVTQKNSIADEIEKLQSLKNNNIISDEEFIRLRTKIIDSNLDYEDDYTDIEENIETNTSINENSKNFPIYGNPNLKLEKPSLLNVFFIVSGIIILFIITLNTCDNNSNDSTDTVSEVAVDTTAILSDTPKETIGVEENTLKNFTYEDIARYAMATSMQEPVSIIKSHKKDNYYYVAYVRPSDSQKFEFKVKFEGNRIIWGDLNGRWQDTEYDEKISFEEIGNKINIIGIGDTVEFKKGD